MPRLVASVSLPRSRLQVRDVIIKRERHELMLPIDPDVVAAATGGNGGDESLAGEEQVNAEATDAVEAPKRATRGGNGTTAKSAAAKKTVGKSAVPSKLSLYRKLSQFLK